MLQVFYLNATWEHFNPFQKFEIMEWYGFCHKISKLGNVMNGGEIVTCLLSFIVTVQSASHNDLLTLGLLIQIGVFRTYFPYFYIFDTLRLLKSVFCPNSRYWKILTSENHCSDGQ